MQLGPKLQKRTANSFNNFYLEIIDFLYNNNIISLDYHESLHCCGTRFVKINCFQFVILN